MRRTPSCCYRLLLFSKNGELLWSCGLVAKPEFKQLLHREGSPTDQQKDQHDPPFFSAQGVFGGGS